MSLVFDRSNPFFGLQMGLQRLIGTQMRPADGFVSNISGFEFGKFGDRDFVRFSFKWAALLQSDGTYEDCPILTGWSMCVTPQSAVVSARDNTEHAAIHLHVLSGRQAQTTKFLAPSHKDFVADGTNPSTP